MSREELSTMCTIHLRTRKPDTFYTEFSSWAASIDVALFFIRGRERTAYISVIDTKELLANPTNVIVHVPRLAPLGVPYGYHWEYLAHGVISSSTAHKAIPVSTFMNAGVSCQYGFGLRMAEPLIHPLSDLEIRSAVTVATQYRLGEEDSPDHKFGVVIMLAILCLKKRDLTLWRDKHEARKIAVILDEHIVRAGFDVPLSWYAEDTALVMDAVYLANFGEVEQLIHMLQAIAKLRHGRGSRTRRPPQ